MGMPIALRNRFKSFVASRGGLCRLKHFDAERVRAAGLDFRYYSADVHGAAFVLPAFQADRLRPLLRGVER